MDSPGLLGDGHARRNRHRSDSLLHFLAAQVSLLVLMPSETEVGLVLPLLWGRFALIPKGYFFNLTRQVPSVFFNAGDNYEVIPIIEF